MKKLVILLIFLVLLLVYTASAEPVYDVIDLDTLGSTYGYSSAYSINNNGQIVGAAYNIVLSDRAIFFDSTGNGNNIDLGTLPGKDGGRACSINNHGQIVGEVSVVGYYLATLFDLSGDGNNIDLGTLGGSSSYARSINDNGQIVGSAHNTSGKYHATFFDSTGDGNNIDLGTLGGDRSKAYSINNSGLIIGEAQDIMGNSRATLFYSTHDGNNIDLGTLSGGGDSQALSINDNGQIVGWAVDEVHHFLYRATLFDPTGNADNIDLGTLGGSISKAYSINNSGQIVGEAQDTMGSSCATLFDSTGDGNNIDLNTLIDPNLGWTLREAYGINDNGWIVGSGTNPDGHSRAFLLRPANTAPVAVAGPNQTVHVCDEDGLAEVNLDGLGSYDDDGDELDYYWSWVIDGNLCETNGLTPTIQLPVGEHEIELVVDDGTEFSEPDYCTITVEGPLHAYLFCRPSFLNAYNRRGIITAVVCISDDVTYDDIDANEPLIFMPGGAESTREFVFQWRSKGCTWIIASFDKGDCIDHLSPGINRIKVTGKLKSGKCYYGNSKMYLFKPRTWYRQKF